MTSRYPRDLRGYSATPPDPCWPNEAKLAVQFVINYEEGGENCILHEDSASEAFLSEIVGAAAWPGQRHWNMESIYEYGARAGFWRLHRMFTAFDMPVTVYGVATALARSPEQVRAMQDADWEIASHGLKWIDYKDFTPADEARHMQEAIQLHEQVTGARPLGWYTGRCSENTVHLAAQTGQFEYVADSYADDLPYWVCPSDTPQLIVPYTLDCNDMRFATPQGFNSGDQFFTYLRDSFDVLYAEGQAGAPKMMSIGLHCRLAGRPGRALALQRFLDHVTAHTDVWVARRVDIARHWKKMHPVKRLERPSEMTYDRFVSCYGAVFENSQWIAEQAFEMELGPAHDSATGLHHAMVRAFRTGDDAARLEVLKRYSITEQLSAAFGDLTDKERDLFAGLCRQYRGKFGFPFIIAMQGYDKASVLSTLQYRLANTQMEETQEAYKQLEQIAEFRLRDLLP